MLVSPPEGGPSNLALLVYFFLFMGLAKSKLRPKVARHNGIIICSRGIVRAFLQEGLDLQITFVDFTVLRALRSVIDLMSRLLFKERSRTLPLII